MIGTLKKELNSSNMQDFLENDHDIDVMSQGIFTEFVKVSYVALGGFYVDYWNGRLGNTGKLWAFFLEVWQHSWLAWTKVRAREARQQPCRVFGPKEMFLGLISLILILGISVNQGTMAAGWFLQWNLRIYYDQYQSPAFWTKSFGKETSTGNSFRRSNESSTCLIINYVICNDLKEQYIIVECISG